jgi:nucleoside-diphosphate-sugar epimerase
MLQGISAYDDIDIDLAMCKFVEQNYPSKAFIVMSSCAVDYPQDPYCIVKRTLEAMALTLKNDGVNSVILRPFSGYGSDQSLEYPFPAILNRALNREDPLTVWGGTQVRDWLHIDDLTDAIMYGIDNFPSGVPIDIGTGIGTNFYSLAKQIADAVGYTPQIIGDATKATSSTHRVAMTATAEHYGWTAKIPLEEGIRRAVADKT